MQKRSRRVPQRSEFERQLLIGELRRWRKLGRGEEQRRAEAVLRLDWEHGWPEGESVPEDPCPEVDLP